MMTSWTTLCLRLFCLFPLFVCGADARASGESPQPPTVGAIRWDGWFEGNPWQRNLAEERWRYRLPFFAAVSGEGSVSVCEDAQEVMDREIRYAAEGGLNYWAFCYYHPKSWKEADSYNYGWKRYLASPNKSMLNFCLLLQGASHLGPPEDWPQTVAQFVGFFKEATYQRVCGNRPLVYIYGCDKIVSQFGSTEAAQAAMDLLRKESEAAGLGAPYVVAQIWLHQIAEPFIKDLGFDAVSAYSAQAGTGDGLAYSKLAESNRMYREQFVKTGMAVIPLVNAGWDGRPRQYKGAWYAEGKPKEIAANLREACRTVRGNPGTFPAQTVLIYAWNEFDEGGWLCPTLREGSARLAAIRKVLKR